MVVAPPFHAGFPLPEILALRFALIAGEASLQAREQYTLRAALQGTLANNPLQCPHFNVTCSVLFATRRTLYPHSREQVVTRSSDGETLNGVEQTTHVLLKPRNLAISALFVAYWATPASMRTSQASFRMHAVEYILKPTCPRWPSTSESLGFGLITMGVTLFAPASETVA